MNTSSTPSPHGLKPTTDKQELDTLRFLLFLGVSGGLINFFSVFGLNIWPEPAQDEQVPTNDDDHTILEPSLLQEAAALVREHPRPHIHEQTPLLRDDTAVEDLPATTSTRTLYRHEVVSVSGKEFFLDRDAQYFFFVMICLAGTGLMIINSISAMVDTVALSERADPSLSYYGKPAEETSPVASMRAAHVGLISLSSYAGRILAGFGSDVAMTRYGAQRIYVLPFATACMGLSQVVGMFASLRWLYACSILTGLAYGGFFGVAGIIVAELWGEETCGQNW